MGLPRRRSRLLRTLPERKFGEGSRLWGRRGGVCVCVCTRWSVDGLASKAEEEEEEVRGGGTQLRATAGKQVRFFLGGGGGGWGRDVV